MRSVEKVRVQSSVGEGTIFSFSIPLSLATENANLQRTEVAIPVFSSAIFWHSVAGRRTESQPAAQREGSGVYGP